MRWGRGDFVPWFEGTTRRNPAFQFDTAAGRLVVVTLFASAGDEASARLLGHLRAIPELDDDRATWFGISADPRDLDKARGGERIPGMRIFIDPDGRLARLLRARDPEGDALEPQTLVLSPMLRVLAGTRLRDPDAHGRWLRSVLAEELAREQARAPQRQAPVLMVEDVLEPAFCRALIALYQAGEPKDSGFMQAQAGRTVGVIDHRFKRRRDFEIEDEGMRRGLRQRLVARLVPALERAFAFKATRIERYIVACYDGAEAGRFNRHRDNTTPGTAHRRFACTINLNAEDYEGGNLRFPEFGPREYRAPTGGAVVFGCSLQHEAVPVTRGLRYCTLPFLYDEEAAGIRLANADTIDSLVR